MILLDHLLPNEVTSLQCSLKDSRILVSHPSHCTKVKCSRSWWVQSSWHTEPCGKTLTGPWAIGYTLHMSESYDKGKYEGLSAGSTWFLRVSPAQANRTGVCSWLPGQSSDVHLSNLCWLNTCYNWGCRQIILASRTALVLTILLVIFQLNKTVPSNLVHVYV